MDADGVDVLHAAYGDGAARAVAHDLELDLLPAEDVLLDQHLVYGRGVEARCGDGEHLLLAVGDAAAGAAEGEGGTDDDGVADGVRRGEGRGQGLRRAGGDGGLAYLGHGVLEELPVLALEDGVDVGADEPDAVLAQEAGLVELHGEVQARLPAEAGEEAVGLFLFDYALHRALVERLDIDRGGHVGVGHDRGRVGVHQHGLDALLHEQAAGLGAGVVELRGLAYDDGPGAYDEDLFNAVILRHLHGLPSWK